MWEREGVVEKFKQDQHLILTGGSPLKQQRELGLLIERFIERFDFKPIIEIENECVLPPSSKMIEYVDIWNNSPKLESSGNSTRARYKPNVIKQTAQLKNSWFKFVVTDEYDWEEIERDYLTPGLIQVNQVVLMPEGQTREELERTRELTVNLAIEKGVRYSDRLHVVVWDKKTGV
jgi:7-carboxy-7-deazaguanine synthase